MAGVQLSQDEEHTTTGTDIKVQVKCAKGKKEKRYKLGRRDTEKPIGL